MTVPPTTIAVQEPVQDQVVRAISGVPSMAWISGAVLLLLVIAFVQERRVRRRRRRRAPGGASDLRIGRHDGWS